MDPNDSAVRAEIDRLQVSEEAARQLTNGFAKAIKIILPIAWLMPIIPFLGFFLLVAGAVISAILSVMIVVKGAKSRGLKYFLISVLGSGAAAILWIMIYGATVAVFG